MNRAHARLVSVLAALAFGLAMTPAYARPFRVNEIPNGGVNSCYTCHYSNGGRNAFGTDLQYHYGVSNSGADVPWAKVYDTDSDNDGQTNGQELGDPCGTWTPGTTPQFTCGISNPGDATSTTTTVPTCANAASSNACPPPPVGSGGSGQPPAASGGCSAASGPASLAAFLLIGLAGLATRRRPARARRR